MKHLKKSCHLSLFLCLSIVPVLALALPARGETPSELLRLRRGVHKTNVVTFTRLAFDLKGERPTGIASLAPDKLSISFREFRSKVEPEIRIPDPASTVTAIRINEAAQSSQVVVQYRVADCVVSHSYLPPATPDPGAYRLVVDILPPKEKPAEAKDKGTKATAKPAEKPPEPPKTDTSTIKPKIVDASGKAAKIAGSSDEKPAEPVKLDAAAVGKDQEKPGYREIAEAALSGPLKEANRLLAAGKYDLAFTEYSVLLRGPALLGDESTLARYGLADSLFFMRQEDLASSANEIADHYASALKADSTLAQACWAYYRSGLAYLAAGEQEKAFQAFKKAVQDYPKHPAAPLCWLELAALYQKTAAHAQTIRAARSALESPLDRTPTARAYWLLGSSLHAAGEYVTAKEALERCLAQEPQWYREQPHLLKYLGESYFFQKEYDKGRDYLLWYLNLQPTAPDRDLILAKIAEIFSAEDDVEHANKLYDHIGSNYPDSGGDVIARIRRADFSKSRGRLSPEDDLTIFRELAQKPLSPQLRKLVQLRLAAREHEYGNFDESISIIDGNLRGNATTTSNHDFLVLRGKVVRDWLTTAHQKRDHATVVQLHEQGESTAANAQSPGFKLIIADGYAGIKQYQKAIALYEEILTAKGDLEEGDILARMAEAALQAKDLEKAGKYCARIQGPKFERKKMVLLAQIYFAQQQYAKVAECLGRLPEDEIPATGAPSMRMVLSESLSHLGECDRAATWLRRTSEQMEQTESHSDELVHCYLAQAACYTKSEKPDRALAVLEEAITIAGSENLRDQLNYDISKRYLQLGQIDKAVQRLTGLMQSPQSFWQTAAKQQLDYIQMERK